MSSEERVSIKYKKTKYKINKSDFYDTFQHLKEAIKTKIKNCKLERLIITFPEEYSVQFGDLPGIFDDISLKGFLDRVNKEIFTKKEFYLIASEYDEEPKWSEKPFLEQIEGIIENNVNKICKTLEKNISQSVLEDAERIFKISEGKINKNEEKNDGIFCRFCKEVDFKGKRFICAECDDYNLCSECEKLRYHLGFHTSEHNFIEIKKSINECNVLNNIISPNHFNIVFNSSNSEITFAIINKSNKTLKNCFFMPVRFGEQYLKCIPKKITLNDTNEPVITTLEIELPKKGKFEGFFRLFTAKGIPFGDVISVNADCF